MKAFCNLVYTNPNRSLCFTQTHMYDTFKKYAECSDSQFPNDTTHYLMMDVDGRLDGQIQEISNLRKQGIKTILMTFDPANFKRVDNFIDNGMLDKVIVFDARFKDRFRIDTFISDYFFNEDVFPKKQDIESKGVCIFGHLDHGRSNDYNLPRVDCDPTVKNYWDLYSKVQHFNGVAVYDTGLDENRGSIVHYNKAKYVESLMVGVNGYCQDGIKTKRYDRFLKKYFDIPNEKDIDFSQEEIFKINRLTIAELLYECEYI